MSPEDLAEAVSPDLANKGAQDGKLLTQFLTVVAPDRALCACARQVPAMDRPYRTMIDGVLVAIAPVEIHPSEFALISDTVARHVFAKRLVDHIQWSPDSKFLVFTTSSSGGHSPWHFQSFFFCLEDKSFRNLEEALGGTVTSGDFEFEPPHTVVMTVGLAPERQVRASLSDLVGKSKPITDKPAE